MVMEVRKAEAVVDALFTGRKLPPGFAWVKDLTEPHQRRLACELRHAVDDATLKERLDGKTPETQRAIWHGVERLLKEWLAVALLDGNAGLRKRIVGAPGKSKVVRTVEDLVN